MSRQVKLKITGNVGSDDVAIDPTNETGLSPSGHEQMVMGLMSIGLDDVVIEAVEVDD